MIQNLNNLNDLDNLPPEKARFVLAETKLKLQNIMTHLEMLETRLAHSDKRQKTHEEPFEQTNPAHQ